MDKEILMEIDKAYSRGIEKFSQAIQTISAVAKESELIHRNDNNAKKAEKELEDKLELEL